MFNFPERMVLHVVAGQPKQNKKKKLNLQWFAKEKLYNAGISLKVNEIFWPTVHFHHTFQLRRL